MAKMGQNWTASNVLFYLNEWKWQKKQNIFCSVQNVDHHPSAVESS